MILTNADVQAQLGAAITRIHADILTSSDELFVKKLVVAVNLLELMRMYSSSSNNIPGLRGLGLEQALLFSNQYVSQSVDMRMFDFRVLYKALGSALS